MGHPTKLTPAIHKAIVQGVKQGMYIGQAAALLGIHPDTARDWVERGEARTPSSRKRGRPNPAMAAFARDIRKAQAYDQAKRIKRITEAAKGGKVLHSKRVSKDGTLVTVEERRDAGDWKADAWFLERSYPDKFGNKGQLFVHVDILHLAQKMADQHGLTVDAIMAEAEALVRLLPGESVSEDESPESL